MKDLITELKRFYLEWDRDSMARLVEIYDKNVVFEDPYHSVKGLQALEGYFIRTMKGVNHCSFEFVDEVYGDSKGCLEWVMTYSHPRVSGGDTLKLTGATWLIIDNESKRISRHKDYYDTAEMLFDHIPIVGWVTKRVKAGLARH